MNIKLLLIMIRTVSTFNVTRPSIPYLITMVIFLHAIIASDAQVCQVGDLIIKTQANANDFNKKFPNCKILDGNVYIYEAVYNLDSLYYVERITGNLAIYLNDSITHLDGFQNLNVVEGHVSILGGWSLQNISNISEIKAVDQIDTIYGNASVSLRSNIEYYDLFKSLKVVNFIQLSAMNITTLPPFNNLNTANAIQLINCKRIKNIDGFVGLNFDEVNWVFVYNNDSLSSCSDPRICSFLEKGGKLNAFNNGSGCKSESQVKYYCGIIDTLTCDTTFLSEGIIAPLCDIPVTLCSLWDILDDPNYSNSTCFPLSNYNGHWNYNDFPVCMYQDSLGFGVWNNDRWFSFYSWCDSVELIIKPTYCFAGYLPTGGIGIQAGLYELEFKDGSYCHVDSIDYISCYSYGPDMSPINLKSNNLEKGKLYHVGVDGWAGSICDIEVEVIHACNFPGMGDWQGAIDLPDTLCTWQTYQFDLEIPEYAEYISWEYYNVHSMQQSNDGGFKYIDSQWVSKCVMFSDTGIFIICAYAQPVCGDNWGEDHSPLCKEVYISSCGMNNAAVDTAYFCDYYQYNPYPHSQNNNSKVIDGTGYFPLLFEDINGCDSIVGKYLIKTDPYPISLDPIYKCPLDSVLVDSIWYYDPGEYTFTRNANKVFDCDTLISFQIMDLAAEIDFAQDFFTLAPGDSVTLTASVITTGSDSVNYIWVHPNADTLYYGNNLGPITIIDTGQYCLVVEMFIEFSAVGCQTVKCVEVLSDSSSSTTKFQDFSFILYPNPAQSELNVVLHHYHSPGDMYYTITNSLGSSITNGPFPENGFLKLDVSFWPPGAYFVTIHSTHNHPWKSTFMIAR